MHGDIAGHDLGRDIVQRCPHFCRHQGVVVLVQCPANTFLGQPQDINPRLPSTIHIDTGSGGVKLTLPLGFSADVEASTGSGGIDLGLDEPVTIHHKDRNELEFRIGNGDARVTIDTGSGGITIGN